VTFATAMARDALENKSQPAANYQCWSKICNMWFWHSAHKLLGWQWAHEIRPAIAFATDRGQHANALVVGLGACRKS